MQKILILIFVILIQSLSYKDAARTNIAPPPLVKTLGCLTSTQNQRDHFLLNLSYGRLPTSSQWPPLNSTEQQMLASKVESWLRHAIRQGDAGHIQFGQVMPQVRYSDPNMTSPVKYDDVGDSAAWTGLLLAALVHKYFIDEDPTLLPSISKIINAWDFYTHNCTGMHGFVPRAWATPSPRPRRVRSGSRNAGIPTINIILILVQLSTAHTAYTCTCIGIRPTF